MIKLVPTSLRAKIMALTLLTSVIISIFWMTAWLYIEVDTWAREAALDTSKVNNAIQTMVRDEYRREPNKEFLAHHIERTFFAGDPQVIRAEVTDPEGAVIAAKPPSGQGRLSAAAREIRTSVRKNRPITRFWALRKPGDLEHKERTGGLSLYDLRPKSQETILPIIVDGQPLLALRVYWSLDRVTPILKRVLAVAALIALNIAMLSALGTFLLLDRLIYKPILRLEGAAEQIAAGDTNARAPTFKEDEFNELAGRINYMTNSLISARSQAEVDALTGLFNYRHLQNFLRTQVDLAERYGRDLTVAMIDVDHFKTVNDKFGHPVGDEVLYAAARFMKSQLRKTDYVARYGGEEFVIVMPETGIEAAMLAMEKLRSRFPSKVFVARSGGPDFPVFISLGVADYPFCAKDPANLLAAADQALLFAKKHGRNRLVYARGPERKAL